MTPTKPAETLVNDLAKRIRQRIQTERLPDGSLFMTEIQLAEEYGVSRTVAREAMSRLRALGIVEGRKRKGLVIRRPDPLKLLSESLPSLIDSPKDLRELAFFRYALELGALELAVVNGTDTQRAQLQKCAAKIEKALREHAKQKRINELDLKFHGIILEMTGSWMLSGLQQMLSKFFQNVQYDFPDPPTLERVVWQHHELCRAICDRDLDRSLTVMRQHLSFYLRPEVRAMVLKPPKRKRAAKWLPKK